MAKERKGRIRPRDSIAGAASGMKSKGGKGGGGTQLTEAGEAAIGEFNRLLLRLESFLTEETSGLQL